MLTVYTSRISYSGPDRLDITRGSGDDGLAFAPSWRIVRDGQRGMKRATWLRGRGRQQEADWLAADTWGRYRARYRDEMIRSVRYRREHWDALLGRDRVVLCCYCVDPHRCHRSLLAGYLAAHGAELGGELAK